MTPLAAHVVVMLAFIFYISLNDLFICFIFILLFIYFIHSLSSLTLLIVNILCRKIHVASILVIRRKGTSTLLITILHLPFKVSKPYPTHMQVEF